MTFTFFAPGAAAPKGSIRFGRNRKTGAAIPLPDSRKLRSWEATVRIAASDAILARRTFEAELWPTRSAVHVEITFAMARPKGHFGTGRNANVLRANAPRHPTVKPDIDKTTRSVLDAITGVVIGDDAAVCGLAVRKRYAMPSEPVGCRITVEEME